MAHKRPAIVIGTGEHETLQRLAMAGRGALAEDAENLLGELERARVLPQDSVPAGIVRMGSKVRFRTETGAERSAVLVYPAEADISRDLVSVLTPVGTALIGLRQGQSITWTGRDGADHVLTVVAVEQLEPVVS
jgi:regulator of nucleoside diphosphate kinase